MKLKQFFSSIFLGLLLSVQLFTPVTLAKTIAVSPYYTNAYNVKVLRPIKVNQAPIGASAKCRDGSYSFSRTRRGTCSHHGGVSRWL